jgi:hypothetical protein
MSPSDDLFDESGPERRTSDRYAPDWLQCSCGHVLDVSSSGLRLLATRSMSGEHELRLWGNESSMSLIGRVMWSRRLGFRRHEVGIQFIAIDDETAAALDAMSSGHSFRA